MTAITIDDLRELARRRLPRALFDYVDGGAHDEATLEANREDLRRIAFRPRVLVDVGERSLETGLLGVKQALPLVLAPAGNAGMLSRRGEIAAARAAEAAGIPFCLSTMSIVSMEDVAAGTSRPFWFQLYVMRDRGLTRSLVERAQAAGASALVFTADLPVSGQRDRDLRNGFTVPPRLTPANLLDVLRHPRWIADVLLGPRITFANLADSSAGGSDIVSVARHVALNFDASITWRDVEWARSIWRGPLIVKGILSPEDARLAAQSGADGVVVSNHGGRQLDGAPSTISVLPAIADAVGDRLSVIFDGGIRRGTDVLKALALGADACMIGRAFLYGLAAMGEAGVARSIEILKTEMDTSLALLGRRSIAELDRNCVATDH